MAEAQELQLSQAVIVRFESDYPRTVMHAGQVTRLVKRCLEQLGFYYYRDRFYLALVGK